MSFNDAALYLVQGLTLGAQYSLLAVSLSLVFRMSGMVNFAAGDIAAVAALFGGVTLAVDAGIPLFLAIVCGVLAAGLISAAVSYVLLPPNKKEIDHDEHTLTWVIAAVATSIVIQQLARQIWSSDQRSIPSLAPDSLLMISNVPIRWPAVLLIAVAFVVTFGLDVLLRKTRWGIRVRAAAADNVGAAVSGINFRLVYLQVFIVGGMIAGLAGLLISPLTSASPFMGFALTINAFIAGALGGLGSIRGALAGGMLLGIVQSYAGAFLGAEWQNVVALGLLMLILAVRPTGIMPRRVTRAV